MRSNRRIRGRLGAVLACTVLAGGLLQSATALAAPHAAPRPTSTEPGSAGTAPGGRVAGPDKKLGKGWRSSKDRAVTAAADVDGLHVLVADSARAYEWKTAAVLSEPGMPADSWLGNQCVMDRDHAAVVYAPRTFTNKPDLMQGGAFAAVVNLATGKVTKLPFTASLAYFDPSCNPATRTAAFTAFRDMNDPAATRTRVVTVDTTGKTVGEASARGEVTSAVPVAGGAVGALGHDVVRLGHRTGKAEKLFTAGGVPYDIHPVGGGRIAFVERRGTEAARARVWGGHGAPATVATGRLGELDLERGGAAGVFLTGRPTGATHTAGTGITRVNAPTGTVVSSQGRLAVDPVLTPGVRAGLDHIANAGKGFTRAEPAPRGEAGLSPATVAANTPVTVTSTATGTGARLRQTVVRTDDSAGRSRLSPALTGASVPDSGTSEPRRATLTAAAAVASQDPTDPDRWCSVSRNDVNAQALQPTPNQVEWAVDMAVRGQLRSQYIRQGGYRNQTGIGTIDPQGLFPAPTLTGGGRIPANVMLGIMAQESNLWQAESGSIPGQMGSPLAAVDGYYGHKADPSDPDVYWHINWDKSDCGYGVGQVTDGMRLAGHEKTGETSLSPALQKAVAVDYATNIAASMKILADKWNEVHTDGQKVTVNDDDASRVENWFTAVWNYNLGFNAPTPHTTGPWGLGWYNNPANPIYKKSWGHPFMDTDVDGTEANKDAAHPQDWPYEEKVMGWSAWSMDTGYSYATSGRQDWPGESGFSSAGFRPAWWVTKEQRSQVSPPLSTFCNEYNYCDSGNPPDCDTEACYSQYWWHAPNATWKSDCATDCGHESIKYQTLVSEPGRGYRLQHGASVCSGAPGTHVVASVANGTESWGDCGQVTSSGSFQFDFNADSANHYEAKADLHQVGGGYGGHFWYAHTRDTEHLGGDYGPMTISGTWTLGQSLDWARVFVHVPDTGAHTQQAHYVVKGVAGGDRDRYVNTHYGRSTWVELGVYHFTGTPRVQLTNTTDDGTADEDIAFTSIAFQELPGKPADMVVVMGDSYSAGEGAGAYSPESDRDSEKETWNACRRSDNSWSRKATLPGRSATLGQVADQHPASADFLDVACSGALTWNVRGKATDDQGNDYDTWPVSWDDRSKYAKADGQFHEIAQMKSGVLSADTTLVALTVGGNDAGFPGVMQSCATTGCPAEEDVDRDIDDTMPKIEKTLREIHDQAPNAKIILLGYPQLFNEDSLTCVSGVGGAGMIRVNAMARTMASKQEQMVASLRSAGLPVSYESPDPDFEGRRACDDPEGINKIVVAPQGDGDFRCELGGSWCISRESYHPNGTGTSAYAQAFVRAVGKL
ncbi:SGNH/GDSL hydrolase family protein [Streptomyces sp. NPDC014793]|uniref:SGNH/GDSL hydrolase family protein n=1 Tax=Streptomyces sp. NPDC014793 TaxID=3364914 RepID=UPI0036FD6E45